MVKRARIWAWLWILVPSIAWADPLVLTGDDVRVVPRNDGWHLMVRQKPGVGSVMLTEAFELPDHKLATYSWRALTPNAVNGSEERVLNGQVLPGPNLYLISSTVVSDPILGSAFEVLIPPVMEYGSPTQPNSRYGRLDVTASLGHERIWFSIRTFAKPHQDYTGPYRDNAFELAAIVVAQSLPKDGSYYVKGNEDLFRRLGTIYKARNASEGVQFLKTLIQNQTDLVICLDLTKSMGKDLVALRDEFLPSLADAMAKVSDFRLGLVEYRDYGEALVAKGFPLSADPAPWIREVRGAEAAGGGDIPEAVVEALDAGLKVLADSTQKHRVLVVFGDAPQHDSPRGTLLESAVVAQARQQGVEIRPVLLPVTPF